MQFRFSGRKTSFHFDQYALEQVLRRIKIENTATVYETDQIVTIVQIVSIVLISYGGISNYFYLFLTRNPVATAERNYEDVFLTNEFVKFAEKNFDTLELSITHHTA